MFRPLGLLNDVACPDHQEGLCASRRTECPFSHTIIVKAKRARPEEDDKPATTATTSKQTSSLTSQLLPKRQRVNAYQPSAASSSSSAMPPRDGAADDGDDDGEGWTTVSHKRPNKAAAATTSSSSSLSTSAPTSSSIIRHVPTISPRQHTNNSGILLSSRNVCLKTLYDHFVISYAPLLDPSERAWVQNAGYLLASQDALQQERDVWQRASKMSYRSSIVTMAVGIKKRDVQAVKRALREAIASLSDNSEDEDQDAKARSLATKMRGLCTEVGTNAAVDEKRRSEERRIKTELSVEKLKEAGLICPVDRLAELGFDVVPPPPPSSGDGEGSSGSSSSSSKGKERARDADADPDEAWGKGSSEPTAVGQKKECERCRREFIVGGEDGKGQDENACHYHWGKKIFERDPTAGVRHRVQVWTCCRKGVESSGLSLSQIASFGGGPTTTVAGDRTCSVGPHVFKEEDVAQLHRREGFVSTERLAKEAGVKDGEDGEKKYLNIIALDCELGYTTGGLSLTRVTLISESGNIIYDSLCKPRADLVDANVQFSGVTKEQISQPGVPSLPEIRRAIARYISPNTVLVGHGLENDLRALRLLHPLLVDTAILFPHPVKGFPFRQKLKDLAYSLLGRTIQAGMSTEGHSSVEDAKASLDLVKWKLEREPNRTPWGEGKEAIGMGGGKEGVVGGSATVGGTAQQGANRSKTVVVSTGVRTLSAGNGAASRPVRPPPQQQQQRGTQDGASAPPRRGSNSNGAASGANGPSLFIPRRK